MSINVAAIMEDPQSRATIDQIQAAMSSDPIVDKMMKAAQTVEDAYEVVKRYVVIKFEDFKAVCDDMMEYFQGPKVALDDSIMDAVAGGGIWSNVWNVCKIPLMASVIGAGIGLLTAGAILVSAPLIASGAVALAAGGVGTYLVCRSKD